MGRIMDKGSLIGRSHGVMNSGRLILFAPARPFSRKWRMWTAAVNGIMPPMGGNAGRGTGAGGRSDDCYKPESPSAVSSPQRRGRLMHDEVSCILEATNQGLAPIPEPTAVSTTPLFKPIVKSINFHPKHFLRSRNHSRYFPFTFVSSLIT
jgi:hypothetical protein